MIIATAGHVDHGKTSLIKQLTGVETDRLEEEQRRGLSITTGFAYLPRSGKLPLGFIDVPGHQRFMNNMIAGISGIDTGLLVVAADDGPMPQTHEHLDVLELLGVNDLMVVISKIDRVDSKRLAQLTQDLSATFAGRPWANPPPFSVSSVDGSGIDALRNELLARADKVEAHSATGCFRLSIDRAFSAKGAGLIVTGTVAAGRISVGDSLTLLPQDLNVRVRGIRVHDQESETAMAGQRCALNLVGKIDTSSIEKGDWLVQPGAGPATRQLDVTFSMLASAPFALKHYAPIKLHIGAKRIAGRIAFLNPDQTGKRLQPGDICFAQLQLEQDVASYRGERFLLRDYAEDVILGGGKVLDPAAQKYGKPQPQRMNYLNAMAAASVTQALSELMAQHQLVNLDRFGQSCNLLPEDIGDLLVAAGRPFSAEGVHWMASVERWRNTRKEVMAVIEKWHASNPELAGIKVGDVQSALVQRIEPTLLMAVITDQLQKKELVLNEGRISRPSFKPAVDALSGAHWQQVQQLLRRCGNRIPLLSQISEQLGIEQDVVEKIMKSAERRHNVHKLSPRRYALPEQLYNLAMQLNAAQESESPITVVTMKNLFDTGRNLTVEILEYFDGIRYTARRDNERVVLNAELPAQLFNR
ncbi:MAG: selenocysteine-specific translation elongation factor [Halioglobus sp.]